MVDLNGDGTEDALVANEETDRVSYWPNLGGGTWGNEVVITCFADGCQSVHAADMDGDGIWTWSALPTTTTRWLGMRTSETERLECSSRSS